MKFLIRLLPPFAAFAPMLALAQGGDFTGLTAFFRNLILFINGTLVPLVFAIAFLVFIWGVFTYFIMGAGDETKRETGRAYMLYGIIGFVIMVTIWGIVNLVATGLFENSEDIQNIPNVPTRNN